MFAPLIMRQFQNVFPLKYLYGSRFFYFLVLSDRAGTEFQVLRHKCILLLLLCGVFSPQNCSSRHLSTKMSAPRKTGVGCYPAPDKVFNDICQNVKVRGV